MKYLPLSLLISVLAWAGRPDSVRAEGAEPRVIVFGIDGLSPDGLSHAKIPNFSRLMKNGAYTWHARAVMPTSSSPNWASMIMGAGPEQHGVTSNDWETNKFEIAPTCLGSGNMFPTLFGVLREQRPGAGIAAFYDWDGFGRLFERAAANAAEHCEGPTNTVLRAIEYFTQKKPNLMFLQLDHVDHAGHTFGHGTPEYYASVEVADKLLGQLIGALEEAKLWEGATILVTSDHGGVKKGHGGATMAELEIPWILAGPGIAKNREITAFVNTYDTAATLAQIYHLKTPEAWIAKPVASAFDAAVAR
jgi:predicted AlkP superfamily pyrophosphatase or phosphodiesterase